MKESWGGGTGLPAGHWIHGVMAKEKARHAKKAAAGKKQKPPEGNETVQAPVAAQPTTPSARAMQPPPARVPMAMQPRGGLNAGNQ